MQEVFENIIKKLESLEKVFIKGNSHNVAAGIIKAIEIVNQEAEKYNNAIIDGKYCFQSCACTEKCDKCSRLRNGDIDWYENIDDWTD